MNIFKRLLSIFKKNQSKNKTDIDISSQNNYIELLICLNNNFDIDITLYMDESLKDQTSGALASSEFLNIINSGKLKNQIWSIINENIRNKSNNDFIDSIFLISNMIEQKENISHSSEDSFIKPSTVFIKNMI